MRTLEYIKKTDFFSPFFVLVELTLQSALVGLVLVDIDEFHVKDEGAVRFQVVTHLGRTVTLRIRNDDRATVAHMHAGEGNHPSLDIVADLRAVDAVGR